MALVLADRVKETTDTTGTGSYSLNGAVAGFQSFGDAVQDGNTTYYSCSDSNNFEIGIGTYASSGNTLARTTILKSSNSNNAVNWGVSTKDIFVTYPADKSVFKDASDDIVGLGTVATLDTGISNNNVPKFTSGVADDDFLRVSGTAIEGRSATEVLSDIGGQASLTFGISNTNAVKIDSSSVADDEYARFTSTGLESRSTAEVLSDIGGQASLTFGISNTNAVKIDSSSVADNEFARFTANGLESRSNAEVLTDIGVNSTASELNLLDGSDKSTSSITIANDDAFIVIDGTTTKQIPASDIASYVSASAGVGTITGVTAGTGLSGGGSSGAVTLNVDAAQSGITSLGTLTSLTVDDITINGSTISDSEALTIDVGGDIILDAQGNDFKFKDNGTEILRITNSSNNAIIRPVADNTDIIFQQRDGTEVARVEDNGTFNVVTDKLAINGTAITSTATEINKLDGVTATTTELNYVDVTTLGTVEASKAVTADANGDITTSGDITFQNGNSSLLKFLSADGTSQGYQIKANISNSADYGLLIEDKDNNDIAKFLDGGECLLTHNHVTKFQTTTDGATVTGDLTASENLLTTDGSVFTVRNDQRTTGSASTAGELNVSDSTVDSKAMFCHSLVSVNPNDARYAKIAELPASDSGKQDHITITGRVGGWLDTNSNEFELTFHNRNAFAFDLHYKDNSTISTIGGIKSYLQSDGTIDIYFFGEASSYSMLTYAIPHSHQATIVEDPVFTASTPSGTENFDSTDPNTYTPALKFPDKQRLSFGNDDDLLIFHNGSHSVIKDDGIGNLELCGSTVKIRNVARTKDGLVANQGGSIELYHDDVKKLETTSTGATVTGDLTIESTDAGASADPTLSLYRNSASPANQDDIGQIQWFGENSADEKIEYGRIKLTADNVTDGGEYGQMDFMVLTNGSEVTPLRLSYNQVQLYKNLYLGGSTDIVFEGSSYNSYETTVTATNPTADRTITLPNATGTVLTSGNSHGGTLVHSVTVSSAVSSVDISSTYITDDYDVYDLVVKDIVPVNDNVYAQIRLGIGGTIQDAVTDYGYTVYQIGQDSSNSALFSGWVDAQNTSIILSNTGTNFGLGNASGETFNGHYRFYNLRSTTEYKYMTHIDSIWRSNTGVVCTTRKGLNLGQLFGHQSDKVDTLRFLISSGNVASGTISLYGYKKL